MPSSLTRRRLAALSIVLLIIVAAIAWWWWQRPSIASNAPSAASANKSGFGRGDANRPMPIRAATAQPLDWPVRLTALGTVTASSSVAVRARVDGPLLALHFQEGDKVKAGQLLAEIDPRPYQVQLTQAEGQRSRDQALLVNAQNDLKRYRELLAQDAIAAQQVDNQESLVRQYAASVASDDGSVAAARLNLSFTRITAPINGRAGLRQLDVGNLVRASDANGLVVITQTQPIDVIFPLPQDNLPTVLKRMHGGTVTPVDVYDREGRMRLGSGAVTSLDNQIDVTTGTVRVRARFANEDEVLFPNQFVNARVTVDTLPQAIVIPTAAIQRGAPGTFVYLINADNSVKVQVIKPGPGDGESVAILEGLAAGDRVVIDGADKLRDGAKVEVIDPAAAQAEQAQQAAKGRERRGRDAAKGKRPGKAE